MTQLSIIEPKKRLPKQLIKELKTNKNISESLGFALDYGWNRLEVLKLVIGAQIDQSAPPYGLGVIVDIYINGFSMKVFMSKCTDFEKQFKIICHEMTCKPVVDYTFDYPYSFNDQLWSNKTKGKVKRKIGRFIADNCVTFNNYLT